jgi:hypothetical protein
VVERSDTTGGWLPPTLLADRVPERFLIRPARLYFGFKKKDYEIGPEISLGYNDHPTISIHLTPIPSALTNQTPKIFWDIFLAR